MDKQPEAIKVVDPVLGDDGVMYRALPKDMPEAMKKLCRGADVITPNWTEAVLLTGGFDEATMRALGERFSAPRLMQMLTRRDNGKALQQAVYTATRGDTAQMTNLVQQLMHSTDGAALVQRIQQSLEK
jgi:pyridoxal/pyridoxine/pyridoxamine kinase